MSKSKRMIQAVGGISVLALMVGGALPRAVQAHHQSAGVAVTIGVSVPLLQIPDLSQGIINGVKVAVAQANAANLVPGVTFKVNALDDTINNAYSPQKDASNGRTFIDDPSTIGEVGPLNSGAAKGSAATYNNGSLVQISPSNSNVDLTDPKFLSRYQPATAAGKGPRTYFRLVTTDGYQGPADAAYAVKVLKAKRVFVVDNGLTYGVGLAAAFKAAAAKLGATVVGSTELDKTQPKLGTDQVAKNIANVSGGNLDLVFFGGEYDNTTGGGTYLADALKANGVKAKLMGGDGIYAPNFFKGSSNGGVLNAYASNLGPDGQSYAPAAAYRAAASKLFPGTSVNAYDIESYDAANLIIGAYVKAVKGSMIKAGQPMNQGTRGSIAKLVGQTKNYKGASGAITFDANGDIIAHVFSIYKATGTGASAHWQFVGATS